MKNRSHERRFIPKAGHANMDIMGLLGCSIPYQAFSVTTKFFLVCPNLHPLKNGFVEGHTQKTFFLKNRFPIYLCRVNSQTIFLYGGFLIVLTLRAKTQEILMGEPSAVEEEKGSWGKKTENHDVSTQFSCKKSSSVFPKLVQAPINMKANDPSETLLLVSQIQLSFYHWDVLILL